MSLSLRVPLPEAAPSDSGVARRAVRAAVALATRQGAVMVVNLVGSVLLARMLAPADFGVLVGVLFVRTFLVALGEAGLGASLIRQPEEPEARDYHAVFTFQQIVLGSLSVALALLAVPVANTLDLDGSGAWLFVFVAVSLWLTSAQTVPHIILERRLDFRPMAWSGVAEAVTFNGLALGLWAAGAGVASFGIALAAQAFIGGAIVVAVTGWRPRWLVDLPRVRRHLRFGAFFAGGLFVSLIKDSITPVLVGAIGGAVELGYVRWAQSFGAYAVLALMLLQRIYLPVFSRLQDDQARLVRAVELSVRCTNALVAPLAVLSLVLAPEITRIVFGGQWVPALPVFYLLWTANLFVPTASPLLGVLNALGHSGLAFKFNVIWMLGTWLLGAPLIVLFGGFGFGLANAMVQLTNFALVRVVKARLPVRLAAPVAAIWLRAGVVGGAVLLWRHFVPVTDALSLGLVGLAAVVLYGALCWRQWQGDVRALWSAARS